MAEILFGNPSVRLNINKVWRKFHNPDIMHKTYKERKEFIYKVKSDLNLEFYFRHSIRRMAHGSQKFWN